MFRREFLMIAGGSALAFAGYRASQFGSSDTIDELTTGSTEGSFEITHTEAEWRSMLSEAQFQVLRKEATERPFTSPLNNEKRAGMFHCAGCDLPLYPSKTKYDSGTGWPSFYKPLPNAVGMREDFSLLFPRTEVHCRRCGGHLGHIFDDGPEPTGKRHCINSVALKFTIA